MLQAAGRLSNNPFGEVWRTRRSATSIVATAAGRVHRSFRLTPSGRFATFGGKCPGCSIIRASLTVALMVSLPSQISAFCALAARSPCICSRLRVALRYAQQPTGLTLPSGAPSGRFAAFGGNSPQGWRFPPVPGGRGVCAPGRKHFLSFWRKRPPQADFFDKLRPPVSGRPQAVKEATLHRSEVASCSR